MATIQNSSIGNIDRRAITVTYADDTQVTCDVTSQVYVTVNGLTVVPTSVVMSDLRTMGILLPDYIYKTDLVQWIYYSGSCKIEDIGTHTELTHSSLFDVTNDITEDLIIYPDEHYDSFISVATCTTLSDRYISGNKFGLLADDVAKEVILRQTALQISQCKNITLPSNVESGLAMAQMYLVEQALQTDMMAYDANDKAIIEEHAGAVGVSYDVRLKGSSTEFPPMVIGLLSQYGCKGSSRGFSQSYVGRS